MCVRTKTSYGCGCEFKTTNECHSSRCAGLERYHYPREGDCRACKRGGDAITRGREGRGRYAQEMSRRDQGTERGERSELPDDDYDDDDGDDDDDDDDVVVAARPATPVTVVLDICGGISPWARSGRREKMWHSPSRRRADEAWLHEHVARNEDLQTIRECLSACSLSDASSVGTGSPPCSPPRARGRSRGAGRLDEPVIVADRNRDEQSRLDAREKDLQAEIRRLQDEFDRRSAQPYGRRSRHDSQDSFDSLHSVRPMPRRLYPEPVAYSTYAPHEAYDSGYGSYGSRVSLSGHGAKTEPYHYSSTPRAINISPVLTTTYGVYSTGFGNRVVELDVISRATPRTYSHRLY